MAAENPYASPQDASPTLRSHPRMMLWSVATVAACALGGCLLGLAIGVAIGNFAPDYYRTVFGAGDDPNFNPVGVGVGLGLTQGTGLGVLAGLVLVALFYWYRARAAKHTN